MNTKLGRKCPISVHEIKESACCITASKATLGKLLRAGAERIWAFLSA